MHHFGCTKSSRVMACWSNQLEAYLSEVVKGFTPPPWVMWLRTAG